MGDEMPVHTAKLSAGLQAVHLADHRGMSANEDQNPPLSLPCTIFTPGYLDIAALSNDSSSLNTPMSSVDHTPDRSQGTSRPSSSEKASVLTPGSFGGGEGSHLTPLPPSEFDLALARNQYLLGNRNEVELYAPRPRRASQMPRSIPQFWLQDVRSNDHTLPGQIVDQVMGFSSPSTFSIPTPNETFQNLMEAPLGDSIFQLDEFRQKLDDMRRTDQDPDLVSPQPETWVNICLFINVLCGQEEISAARYAMLQAAMIYERLVRESNDQILSILNLVLANLFLHGKAALATELLSQAQLAASLCLDDEDPILVSIAFMISIAMKKAKTCGIRILKLRHVVEEMKVLWGENHRYCVTTNYHLAWRLAMEPDLRSEALEILRKTQVRSEVAFDPLHMQTVALLAVQARVLGHAGHHFEAEKTMSEALQRIERWHIKEDHPYYLEAKRRHKIFLDELNRVTWR